MHACMYVCMHACMYVCMYMYMCTHTHTHTHMHSDILKELRNVEANGQAPEYQLSPRSNFSMCYLTVERVLLV